MRVAMCQLNARDDRTANLRVARELLQRAADAGADLAVLPEYVDYLGRSVGAPKPEPVDGEGCGGLVVLPQAAAPTVTSETRQKCRTRYLMMDA